MMEPRATAADAAGRDLLPKFVGRKAEQVRATQPLAGEDLPLQAQRGRIPYPQYHIPRREAPYGRVAAAVRQGSSLGIIFFKNIYV